MPGIAGIISKRKGQENAVALDAMVNVMVHERFYAKGKYINEAMGLWVGWTTLSGSFSDCLPVWNETRDICLIFSGESVADPDDLLALRKNCHQTNFENATWLVHLYEELGPRFFERLNGWFSGVLIDLRQNEAYLFNDRFGINRIYYHENGDGFYFASEAKALLKILPQLRKFNDTSLGEFFSCCCVLQNRTLFSGINLVPGGAKWVFSHGEAVRKENYFDKSAWEQQPKLDSAEYYEKLRETWARILPRYFHGKERIGLSLTGGIDSRLILAFAPFSEGQLPCFTFGGIYRDCSDVRVSRRIAQLCCQPHETISLDKDFFSEFPILAEKGVYVTDGMLDVTSSTDLYVHRRVREISPVRVTGLYGGELLRSLLVFKPMPQSQEHLSFGFKNLFQKAAATYSEELAGHRQSFICFKQAPWHICSRLSIERSQVTIRTPYFDNDLVALSYQAPPESLNYGPALRLISENKPILRGVGTDRAVGVPTMAGIGALRHLYQEFTFRAEYAYDYGMPQWLAKMDHALAPLPLEKLFLGRHKYYHFRLWYRDYFNKYLQDILLDPRALNRPYLNGQKLEKMVKAHITGNGNYTLEIHRALTAELIQRQLIDQN